MTSFNDISTQAIIDRRGHLLTSRNPAMQRVLTMAAGVATMPTTVLLSGESGTGKEVVARFIHDSSPRAGGPFVAVNCAAIPANLMESELFGHEKGAFSGAGERKPGKFELANGGTLLLDEISELPPELQAKLLRVIQERQVTRVGGTQLLDLDVRIVATTNRELRQMVDSGEFRQDLYYRINVFPITLLPLRERLADLPILCRAILMRLATQMGRSVPVLGADALARLQRHTFAGNVRELQNLLERAIVLTRGDAIVADALMFDGEFAQIAAAPGLDFEGLTLADIERQVILDTLRRLDGNRTRTSEVLGISIRTLRNRLREYRGAGFVVTEAGQLAIEPVDHALAA